MCKITQPRNNFQCILSNWVIRVGALGIYYLLKHTYNHNKIIHFWLTGAQIFKMFKAPNRQKQNLKKDQTTVLSYSIGLLKRTRAC